MENSGHKEKAPSAFSAIIQCKCPHCRQGNMFLTPGYKLKSFLEMPDTCKHCGLKFEIEPGFYWGAMYISYAFTVALSINTSIILWWFGGNPSIWVYAAVTGSLVILLSPFLMRYSRVLMLYLFGSVRYKPEL